MWTTKIRSTLCTRLKIGNFEDFSVLDLVGTVIMPCKLTKMAKNHFSCILLLQWNNDNCQKKCTPKYIFYGQFSIAIFEN